MRLAFIGVGNHARTLRTALEGQGASVVAYDRLSPEPAPGWGRWAPWRALVHSDQIDGIVACASPDVSAAVAELCAAERRPCIVTKPCTWQGSSPYVYVDLWRIYCPAWCALRDRLAPDWRIAISFAGSGPERTTHSGLYDYGPHALAFAYDSGRCGVLQWRRAPSGKLWLGENRMYSVRTGNGAFVPNYEVEIDVITPRWQETPDDRAAGLAAFARAFLQQEPSPTLDYSKRAMLELARAPGGESLTAPE